MKIPLYAQSKQLNYMPSGSVIFRTYPPPTQSTTHRYVYQVQKKNRQLRNPVEQTKPLQSTQDK